MQEKIEDLDDENRCKEYYDGVIRKKKMCMVGGIAGPVHAVIRSPPNIMPTSEGRDYFFSLLQCFFPVLPKVYVNKQICRGNAVCDFFLVTNCFLEEKGKCFCWGPSVSAQTTFDSILGYQ